MRRPVILYLCIYELFGNSKGATKEHELLRRSTQYTFRLSMGVVKACASSFYASMYSAMFFFDKVHGTITTIYVKYESAFVFVVV